MVAFAAYNPADYNLVSNEIITFTNGNLTIQATSNLGSSQTNIRTLAIPQNTGKFYYENTLNIADNNGFVGCGISTSDNPGTGTGSVYINFLQNGDWFSSSSNGTIYTYTTGALVQIAVDLDASLAWFRTATNNWNNNVAANPATGVGGLPIPSFAGKFMVPFARLGGSGGTGGKWTGGFGATAYGQTAPVGFGNWPGVVSASSNFFMN